MLAGSVNIEICHPSEAVDFKWKKVEVVSVPYKENKEIVVDLCKEHLSSPTFEWERGTLVRVTSMIILYTGVFSDTHCIDLGPDSVVMHTYRWEYDERCIRQCHNRDFVTNWFKCSNALWMLHAARKILRPSDIYAALRQCNTHAALPYEHESSDEYYHYANHLLLIGARQKAADRGVPTNINIEDSTPYLHELEDFAHIFKRVIPFHHIIDDLLKP